LHVSVATPAAGLSGRFVWLTNYGELLRTLLRRELRAKYKGSTLGVLWSLLHPLLMMGVYTLVFSVLLRVVRIDHYPLYVLSGLAVWAFFQAAVSAGTASFHANANLIKKVWFPREIIPVAVVLAQGVTLAVMLAILIPVNLAVVPETWRTTALAAPILAGLLCLALGFAWILATANVFFRDIGHFVTILFLPWFFLTPVLYSLDQLPGTADRPWLVDVLRYGNPVTPYVEGMRGAILEGTVPGPGSLTYIFVVGPALALFGLLVLQHYEDRFAVEL
jgi:lipopolysaccharide transport system permease protein